jgi:photosystem II stability/assembly factor-like uncharacterized protein
LPNRSSQDCLSPNSLRQFLLFLFCLLGLVTAHAQTVSPDFYNGLKWRLIGPFRGGRAVAVAGVPGNSTTFYFGAVNGGIWKTTDAGVVWEPIFDTQHIASIGALAVAPSDEKIIYAGTGESDIRSDLSSGDGVYKSTDGGQTWTNIGLRDTRQISRIVIDAQNADVAYVAALGHAYGPNAERGVYKTTDGGAHWSKILDQGPEIGAADVAIASTNPNILFATMWHAHRPPWSTYPPIGGPGSGLYRSIDGGKSWTHLTGAGLPDGDWGRAGVAVSPDGRRVYALIDAAKKGLYRSDDGGNTWTLANSDSRLTSRAWYFCGITVDPENPDVIYMPNVALYRSEDGGKTISIVRGAPGGDDYHQIWVDPKDSTRMVLGTDQGTSISLDYGKTWSSWYNQPTAQLYHVITDNKFPYAVYGAQQDSGGIAVLSRTDHGQITARDWFSSGGSESGYIAPDPNDPNIVYISGTYGTVDRFDLRTSLSQGVAPWPTQNFGTEIAQRKYRDPWTPVLLFSPFDKKTLYLGTQYVMKTTDGGLHWHEISPDLTGAVKQPADKKQDDQKLESPPTVENATQRGYGVVYTIAPSSLDGNLIWAGSDTGLIHLTRDGGKIWKNVTPKEVTDWSRVSFIEASHSNPGEAYAAVDRHRLDDQRPYIYRTRDYGETWQLITDGIAATSFVRAVRQDSKDDHLLFAGTELGVYVSFDDGDHWQPLQLNLPASSVQDLVIHGDDLVIATHGRSFWILDDISSLRQANHAMDAAWLYSPAAAVRVDNDVFQGTPLPPEEPTAENPPDGAIIDYSLKSPAEQVRLEILDAYGDPVRSYSSKQIAETKRAAMPVAQRWFPKPQALEVKPGLHRFIWDLTWSPANANSEESEDDLESGGLHGPRVVAGTYTVRLAVDGKTFTQLLTVTMDPRSAAAPSELEQQYRLGKQIFVETVAVRKTLDEIHSVQAQLIAATDKHDANSTAGNFSLAQAQEAITKILSGTGNRMGDDQGLESASNGITAALRVVEGGDRAVPSQAIALFAESDRAAKLRLQEWSQIKEGMLSQLRSSSGK